MSFGFSVGDIILLSQLSYSLYQTVTSGRKNAARDLSELGDVLFGLRCALDHLQHSLEDIAKASDVNDPNALRAVETREKLDLMLQNCADTLEDLDNATRRYRDGADKGIFTAVERSTLSRTARLKRRLASNVMKIRWDMDKESLRSYREKLSSHADAINLLLSSIMWSTTNDIHSTLVSTTETQSEQLAALHAKVSTENAAIAKLVTEIHQAVTCKSLTTTPAPEIPERPRKAPKISGSMKMAAMHSFGHIPSVAFMTHASFDAEIRPHFAKTDFTASLPVRMKRLEQPPVPNLPPSILLLNAKRMDNALDSIAQPKSVPAPLPPSRPAFFSVAKASTADLAQGLKYLLSVNAKPNGHLEKDVTTWVRSLDNTIDAFDPGSKSSKQSMEVVELLICLNDELDRAPRDKRRTFYSVSSDAGIDDTLAKFVKLPGSVRAEKEVEDFEDARDDWLGSIMA